MIIKRGLGIGCIVDYNYLKNDDRVSTIFIISPICINVNSDFCYEGISNQEY
jgi:hypothetical protein